MSISSIVLAVSILFTGDILLDRGVREVINHRGVDYLFTQEVDSLFASCDYVVANLECPATTIRQPDFKRYVFRAEPEWLDVLRAHGITHLNLANNHSIDQGRAGLVDTKRNIEAAGMIPFGAGLNMAEAAEPLIITHHPTPITHQRNIYIVPTLRLALENYSYLPDKPCVSQEPEDSLVARIRKLRANDPRAVIVVCPHWGGEHTLRPIPVQIETAHRIIDAGADLIVGHHTHTLQTIEVYRGRRIYYSIGNFIFDQQKPINTEACVVKLTVDADNIDVETIPISIRRCVPYLNSSWANSVR
ncbi:MAG: CapA family protein [Prevotella sp.]|nr:CapA family protein [Prevotella sp.]